MSVHVLVVDDETEFADALAERLELRGFSAKAVYSGPEAIEYVRKKRPGVMILDLKMPGMDGIEVLEAVKKSFPDVEVIILTGHGSEKDRDMAIERGVFEYFNKPAAIDKLVTAITEAAGDGLGPLSGKAAD